jgi:two-component system response regulator RegA
MVMTTPRPIQKALVVEDSAPLRESLKAALRELFACEAVSADSVLESKRVLSQFTPDLVLLDVELGDGNAFDVLSSIEALSPLPIVVAISGEAGPEEAFRLAQRGVRRYVPKPLDLGALESAIQKAMADAPDVTPHVRAAVGHVPIQQLEELVRTTMLEEALAQSGGNRRGAARLLYVSRQLLQHMLRKVQMQAT